MRAVLLCLAASAALAIAATSIRAYGPHGASDPTGAQPVLDRAPLTITTHDGNAHAFSVELARTARQQQVGEMYRSHVAPDQGMLFPSPAPVQTNIWMRHTLVPLDIVFIAPGGRISGIVPNAVPHSEALMWSPGRVTATLELAGGVTQALGIKPGDQVDSSGLPH